MKPEGRRNEQERQSADRDRQEGKLRTAAEIPSRAAQHRDKKGFTIADREHRRRHARHAGRRTQQRRQGKAQREHDGGQEAEYAGKDDASIRLRSWRGQPRTKA